MAGRSVNRRLMLGATLWIAVALLITGFVLTELFRNHVEINFDKEMHDQLEELLSLAEVDINGITALTRHPVDPRYNRPLSGWYWEIVVAGTTRYKSLSLLYQVLATPDELAQERASACYVSGPRKESLR
ncbi:MAG: sensor histidine kinase, partial [Rhodospirillaceae bacterium]|nr:sensor histidine kinase [Rhodospirillaceae bacterium]